MELQIPDISPDYTISFVLVIIAATLTLAWAATIAHKHITDNENRPSLICLVEDLAPVLIAIMFVLSFFFVMMSAKAAVIEQVVVVENQINSRYSDTLTSEQSNSIAAHVVHGAPKYTANPYEEPVSLGTHWATAADGAVREEEHAYMLYDTESPNKKRLVLLEPGDDGNWIPISD